MSGNQLQQASGLSLKSLTGPQHFHSTGLEVEVLTSLVLALVWVQPVGMDSRLWSTFQLVCQDLATTPCLLIKIFFVHSLVTLMSKLNGLIPQLLWQSHGNLLSSHDQLSHYPEFISNSFVSFSLSQFGEVLMLQVWHQQLWCANIVSVCLMSAFWWS